MAITSLDLLIAAAKQRCELYKTVTRTTVAGGWFCNFDLAGNPGAGTLAVGNTANGIVPTDAIAGYPPISAFGGSNRGYLSRFAVKNTVVSTVRLFDAVFSCGAYAFNANTALASIPSYAARVTLGGGAANYSGLELWVEQVTAATGNQAVNVTYTDQSGNTGNTTGAIGIAAAPTVGRCWPLPLAAGDSGVQVVTNVQGTVATVGTFNVHVLRPLADVSIRVANDTVIQNWSDLGLIELFADSAIKLLVMSPSGTTLGAMDLGNLDVING